jgi:hypothetical protein
MKRFLKHSLLTVAFGVGGLVIAILLWPTAMMRAGLAVLVLLAPTPTYRTGYSLPGTDVEVAIELRPTHPWLSEYERTLVLTSPTKREEKKMFPDTGGYLRTNLYSLGGGRFLVRGFFDEWLVQTQPPQMTELSQTTQRRGGTYIGAFDEVDRTWRFIPAAEQDEKPLVPGGG